MIKNYINYTKKRFYIRISLFAIISMIYLFTTIALIAQSTEQANSDVATNTAQLKNAQINFDTLKNLRGTSINVLNTAQLDIDNRVSYVMLHPEYPVTPGDVYKVKYHTLSASEDSVEEKTLSFFIGPDYNADLSLVGEVNCKGMNYKELKIKIEKKFRDAYPASNPQLSISSVGEFLIKVRGEVKMPGYARAWGFTRLADLLKGRLTDYSSIRNVEVRAPDGTVKRYDLFQAALDSDLSKNPIISPESEVVVHEYDREIYVRGEVRREGAYQLLEGETLEEAVTKYARGFTKLSAPDGLYIVEFDKEEKGTNTFYPSDKKLSAITLDDMDLIHVPMREKDFPTVFFEGAIGIPETSENVTSAKIPVTITSDSRLSTVIQKLPENTFTKESDLKHSYIIRDGKNIPVNLHKVYYEKEGAKKVTLERGDRIVIPRESYTVYVGGAVQSPGPKPYFENYNWKDYIRMAGGFNPDKHRGDKVVIRDKSGNEHPKSRDIQPEDTIFAPRNSFDWWYNNKIGAFITTTSAILSLYLTIDNIVN